MRKKETITNHNYLRCVSGDGYVVDVGKDGRQRGSSAQESTDEAHEGDNELGDGVSHANVWHEAEKDES